MACLKAMRKRLVATAVAAGPLLVGACATVEVEGEDLAGSASESSTTETAAEWTPLRIDPNSPFAVFEPRPDGAIRSIDYELLNDALDITVINTGPSLRQQASRPAALTGSRLVTGHTSPVRLEGNKIPFSQFDDQVKAAFRAYTDSLVEIGNAIDITSLPRNEQLAYWFNLHNLLVITTIAEEYPVSRPREIRINGGPETLHTAELATIKGVPLSLEDIRTKIVYTYWRDPRVMYGFFHGDLSSPNIRDQAWTSANMQRSLDSNAREFINSLRGVTRGNSITQISPHYFEAQPYLFPNWPTDVLDHLYDFANDPVKLVLNENEQLAPRQYEDRVADLAGGRVRSIIAPMDWDGVSVEERARFRSLRVPFSATVMTREIEQKINTLFERGILRGRVTIIDEETTDPGPPEDDVD